MIREHPDDLERREELEEHDARLDEHDRGLALRDRADELAGYRALDGTGDVAGPPGPSNDTIAAWATASLQRSRDRRGLQALGGDAWAAAGGIIIGGAIILGAILGGH